MRAEPADTNAPEAGSGMSALRVLPETQCEATRNAVAIVNLVSELVSEAASAVQSLDAEVDRYRSLALNKLVERFSIEQTLDAAPIGLIQLNREGEVVWFNKEAGDLLGLSHAAAGDGDNRLQACTLASMDGSEPAAGYVRTARRLARGEVVRGVRCVVVTKDRGPQALVVDAAGDNLSRHRLNSVVLTLRHADDRKEDDDEDRPTWSEVRALINVVNTKAVTARAAIARQLQWGVLDQLQRAWLEFDSFRRELVSANEPVTSGCVDVIAFEIQEAAANAAALTSACWPDVWDHHGVAAAIEWRLSEMESRDGVACSFKDRSEGRFSLDARKCTVLYHVAEEMLAEVGQYAHRADVVLDANEHYWLLVVSTDMEAGKETSAFRSAVGRVREELRPHGGCVESVLRDDGRIIQYVIMPAVGLCPTV